jgi:hypothetical protein
VLAGGGQRAAVRLAGGALDILCGEAFYSVLLKGGRALCLDSRPPLDYTKIC